MKPTATPMVTGRPAPLILSFALPLMVGNIFQQLYTVADGIIVGKALGVDALAALGSAEWPNWLILGIIQGLAQGFSIPMSHAYGAGEKEKLKRTIGNAFCLSLIASLFLICISQLAVYPLLLFLETPKDIIQMALLYLRIMFFGIPIVLLFNFQASVLRSMGDGKTPLFALIIASFINIGLDLILVMLLHQGIAGAAISTLIAQVASNIYCFIQLKKISGIYISFKECKPSISITSSILKHGIPMALQNMLITIGSLIVQFVVNQYGVLFIAGFAATNKLYGVLEIAATSYGYAMVTYAGQNLGAKKIERIHIGYRISLIIALATSLIISFLIIIFGKNILLLFLSGSRNAVEQTLTIAYRYLKIMALFLPILYILHVTRSTIQGMGNTVIPMIAGIIELIMRILSALILPALVGQSGIFYAEVLAWVGSVIILIPAFFKIWGNIKKYTEDTV